MLKQDVKEIRTLIARHKRWDVIFALCGIAALMVGILTFLTLFVGMVLDGGPRLNIDFFSNFPSRRAESAGILSAWVGTTLVMIVTAAAAIPLGVGAAVYLEEYAPKNWLTDIIEINVTNLAGVPPVPDAPSRGRFGRRCRRFRAAAEEARASSADRCDRALPGRARGGAAAARVRALPPFLGRHDRGAVARHAAATAAATAAARRCPSGCPSGWRPQRRGRGTRHHRSSAGRHCPLGVGSEVGRSEGR
jgi:hypothetical protein